MADENYRVTRLENDVSKLQEKAENTTVIINKVDKDNGMSEIHQAQIMKNLASITESVAKTLEKATQTEILVSSLKIATDKHTDDLSTLNTKVTHIEMLPAENATRTKWLLIAFVLSTLGGIIIWLIEK